MHRCLRPCPSLTQFSSLPRASSASRSLSAAVIALPDRGIALEHRAIFHDEPHAAQRVDVFERVAFDGDQIGGEARLDEAAAIEEVAGFVAVDGDDAQDFRRRDTGGLPRLKKVAAGNGAAIRYGER